LKKLWNNLEDGRSLKFKDFPYQLNYNVNGRMVVFMVDPVVEAAFMTPEGNTDIGQLRDLVQTGQLKAHRLFSGDGRTLTSLEMSKRPGTSISGRINLDDLMEKYLLREEDFSGDEARRAVSTTIDAYFNALVRSGVEVAGVLRLDDGRVRHERMTRKTTIHLRHNPHVKSDKSNTTFSVASRDIPDDWEPLTHYHIHPDPSSWPSRHKGTDPWSKGAENIHVSNDDIIRLVERRCPSTLFVKQPNGNWRGGIYYPGQGADWEKLERINEVANKPPEGMSKASLLSEMFDRRDIILRKYKMGKKDRYILFELDPGTEHHSA